jgi:hypothetical protein
MTKPPFAGYEEIANEYYNAVRHPTCANFRSASAKVLKSLVPLLSQGPGWICEVGVGESLVAEVLASNHQSVDRLLLVDSSRSMLRHSAPWAPEGAKLIVGDARAIPIASGCLSLLVASVGDPYNEPSFWAEVSRTLMSGAVAMFTTPSYDWASAFRPYSNGRKASAEFELSDGRHVSVQSLIYPPDQQKNLIEAHALLLVDVQHVAISSLANEPVSPKLTKNRGSDASVLTRYIIVKP